MADGDQSSGNPRFAGIVPLDAHLDQVARTGLDFIRLDPRARVRDEPEFYAIKAHIADLYSGLEPVHSFEDIGGTVFDCIPVEQQPSLREHVGPIPEPPDLTPVLHGQAPQRGALQAPPAQEAAERDRHGNEAAAPPGTIPFPRLRLSDICRFESLDSYFHKHAGVAATAPGVLEDPGAGVSVEDPSPAVSVAEHRYARTDQQVANIGGHSAFTLYSPSVTANQIFSLSQHWYYGGSGRELQTVEVGWQVFPGMYSHSMPVLFIYWTPNAYEGGAGSGNYNLTAKGFVATKGGKPIIGSALSPASVQGGQQTELDITVYLYEGNWWIYCGGVEPANALGFYPTSLFSGGQMASNAEAIQFGGETCSETESWPPMGSGAFSEEGWASAAYHRAAYYFPPTGGSQWAESLSVVETPGCYNLGPQPWAERTRAPVPWGAYFYYGGPGGQSC